MAPKKNARLEAPTGRLKFRDQSPSELTLGVLVAAASAGQAVLLTLDFARVASQVTGLLEDRAVSRINFEKSAGDAVLNGACLTGETTTGNVDVDVETANGSSQLENLHDDQARGRTRKIIFEA